MGMGATGWAGEGAPSRDGSGMGLYQEKGKPPESEVPSPRAGPQGDEQQGRTPRFVTKRISLPHHSAPFHGPLAHGFAVLPAAADINSLISVTLHVLGVIKM